MLTRRSLTVMPIALVVFAACDGGEPRTAPAAAPAARSAPAEPAREQPSAPAPAAATPAPSPAAPPSAAATATAPAAPAPAPAPKSDAETNAVFERLSVKAPLDVTNRHVGALLESMGRDAQVEIVFTEAALAGKSAEELTIQNLKFDAPMSYRQSIELIARISGLEWEVHGGRAVIRAAGEKLSDATKLVSCADAANRSAR